MTERDDDFVDLGDALELTQGNAPIGGDDGGAVLRKSVGISQDD